jgi:hypothetical protein
VTYETQRTTTTKEIILMKKFYNLLHSIACRWLIFFSLMKRNKNQGLQKKKLKIPRWV